MIKSIVTILLSIRLVSSFIHPRPITIPFAATQHSTITTDLKATSNGSLNIRATGIGSSVPKTVLTNKDLESVIDTSDEWIQTRTGISQRHVLTYPVIPNPVQLLQNEDNTENHDKVWDENESLKILSIKAGEKAMKMCTIDPLDIDLIIIASSSQEDLFGDASSIGTCLGCDNAFCFDLTAACSGFLFALVTAGQFLQNSNGSGVKNALVIGADALSRFVDWEDRNSCILFGDGAGAMVVSSNGNDDTTTPGILGYSMHSNGKGSKDLALSIDESALPNEISTTPNPTSLTQGKYCFINMNGKEVYKFATREVPQVLQEALDASNLKVDEIDWLLLHQANIRIMEIVASRLGIPMEKVITNLCDVGNTSAASIPLALDGAVREGKVKKGDVVACAGFGAGLSWGAAILRWG